MVDRKDESMVEWENVDHTTWRAWIPGLGWLVKVSEEVMHIRDGEREYGFDWRIGLTFVPDPQKTWEVSSDETEQDDKG